METDICYKIYLEGSDINYFDFVRKISGHLTYATVHLKKLLCTKNTPEIFGTKVLNIEINFGCGRHWLLCHF